MMRYLLLTVMLLLTLSLTATPAHAASCSGADIVLNELAYDDDSTDDREFVELYFPNPVAADEFGNCEIRLLNQTQILQGTLDLSLYDDSGFAAGTYFTWGDAAITTADVALTASIQNGPDDGLALVDTGGASDTVIWYFTYEDSDESEVYLGQAGTNLGTDSSGFCGDAAGTTETTLSRDPDTGLYVEGACESADAPNLDPTAVKTSSLTARSVQDPLLLTLGLFFLAGMSILLLRKRYHV